MSKSTRWILAIYVGSWALALAVLSLLSVFDIEPEHEHSCVCVEEPAP